jgi:LuxR family maltose regulon positive regulatory protein
MNQHLVQTKFIIPPVRSDLVIRDRLLNKLDGALSRQHHLILVSSKAGSGKTTLVSEWIHKKKIETVWLSLDENDNDPNRFFAYLIQALTNLGIEIEPFENLQIGLGPLPEPGSLITRIINAITKEETPLIIVLDDFHFIHNAWIYQMMELLVDQLPPTTLLVLLSRVDPPLPLSRLRGRDQLTEIRDRDLRFTASEADQYLKKSYKIALPQNAISALEERTEGWIVGLQLAAISLLDASTKEDKIQFINDFSGSNSFILDYLTDEILSQQTAEIRNFLLDTSLLTSMCGSLCDAVCGDSELPHKGQSILESLEKANLFVIPIDNERHWYRYHHLFADLLKKSLTISRGPAEIKLLHSRAADWYQDHEIPEEAMAHAIAAEDYDLAGSIIDDHFSRLFSRNEVPVFLSWIEQLPDAVMQKYPWIILYQAYTLALSGEPDQVDPLLELAEQKIHSGTSDLQGHITAIRAYTSNLKGNASSALQLARAALKDLSGSQALAQGLASYTLADTNFAGDDLTQAGLAYNSLLGIGKRSHNLLMIIQSLSEMARIQAANGELYEAEMLFGQAYEWLIKLSGLGSRERCAYEFGLAELLCEKNLLDEAYEHLQTGLQLREQLGGFLVVGELAAMRVHQTRGDQDQALKTLLTAEKQMDSYHFELGVGMRFRAAKVTQWLQVGNMEMASRAEDACGPSELEKIARAKLWLAQGRFNEASSILDQQINLAESGKRLGRLLEIYALRALASQAQGNDDESELMLLKALSLAGPQGYKRVFLDLGKPLSELLDRIIENNVQASTIPDAHFTQEYALSLRESFGQKINFVNKSNIMHGAISHDAMRESLTKREVQVLNLLAEGITNKELAINLCVEPSTVKQHLKNIYRKLDVGNRTQAVAQARELGILKK